VTLLLTVTEPRLLVELRRALSSPLLLSHRLVADDVLAQHVLELLRVTPVLRVTIFHPEYTGSDIRRNMLNIRSIHRFLAIGWHENLDGLIVITVGTLVKRTLCATARL
jgi:hypothetical protein